MPNQERTFAASGKTHTLRFTHHALYRWETALAKPLAQLDGQLDSAELQAALWAGLEGARLKAGLVIEPVTRDEADTIIAGLGASAANSLVIEALRSALPANRPPTPSQQDSPATAAPLTRNWEQLLADALELGLKPHEFWNFTPKELAMYAAAQARRIQNEIRRNLAIAWNIAALVRSATLPPLNQILDQSEPAELSQDELARRRNEFEELKAAMLRDGGANG